MYMYNGYALCREKLEELVLKVIKVKKETGYVNTLTNTTHLYSVTP